MIRDIIRYAGQTGKEQVMKVRCDEEYEENENW